MFISISVKRAICTAFALLTWLSILLPAEAGNTWTGTGSSNWSDNNNWSGVSQPGYGTLTFSGAAGTTNSDDNITAMNQLFWNGTSSWTLNQGGSTVLSLYDFGGTQAKIENQSTGLVTINLPIDYAANNGTPSNPFGEINAISGDLNFGSGTLTVDGTSVNGIKFWGGSPHSVTFNNTVNASGKWFATTGSGTVSIGSTGNVTTGDIYIMNDGSINLNAGGSLSATAIRFGGDFGTTGNQDQTKGATFSLTSASGGQSFGGILNSASANSSNNLTINALNTSGTDVLNGATYLDGGLTIQTSAGGNLVLSGSVIDIKSQFLFLNPAGTISITNPVTSSNSAGNIVKSGAGDLILNGSNSFGGSIFVDNGTVATASNGAAFGTTNGVTTGVIGLGPQFNNAQAGNTTLSLTAAGASLANPINARYYGFSFAKTIGSTNTTGTATYGGAITLNDSVTLTAASGGTTVFSGNISTGTVTGGQTVNGNPGITVNAPSGTVTLTGTQSYQTLSVQAGTARLGQADSSKVSIPNLSLSDTTLLQVTTHTIPGTGIDPEGSAFVKVLDTSSLLLFGSGTIDLTNNAMIVRGGNDFAINALVASGFNSFSNNGPGINSSTAAGGAPTTVGELDNSILNLSTWEGVSGLDTDPNGAFNQILVRYTWYGDANLDGTVTPDDYLLIDAGTSGSGTGWLFGDFNYDGTVSPDDYLLIDAGSSDQDGSQFTGGTGGKGDGLAGETAAVPEPSSIGLLLVGTMGLLTMRRRARAV